MARRRFSKRAQIISVAELLEPRRLLANINATGALLLDTGFNPDPTPNVGSQVYIRLSFTTTDLPSNANYNVGFNFYTYSYNYNINWGAGLVGSNNWTFDFGYVNILRGAATFNMGVDINNTVAESNEADNTASITFTPIQLPITGKLAQPIDGVAGRTYSYVNYVDKDPSSGFSDYRGGPHTYDGHDAIDMTAPTFASMDAGTPIVAALGGTVVYAQDGFYDRNATGGFDANFIEIDSGNGYQQYYYHLREGSVGVQVGQTVQQGQVIGLMGASGNAYGAHLHFSVYNGNALETFEDPYAYWQNPAPYQGDDDAVIDSGVTSYVPTSILNVYERPPESRNFKQRSGQVVYSWFIYDSAASEPAAITYFKPNGTTYATINFTTGANAGGYSYTQATLPSTPDLGTWQVAMSIAGVELARNSFVVSAAGGAAARVDKSGAFIASNRETPIDGGTFAQSSSSTALSLTITNYGEASMSLGSLSLPTGWTLTDGLAATLAGGATDTLALKLDTSVVGYRYGTVSFTTSDPNNPTYNFAVDGTVTPTSATPAVAIYTRAAAAAETGRQPGVFRFNRTGDTSNQLTINYSIGGGAGNGSDYSTIFASVTIPVGQSEASVIITPIDDASPESAEQVTLTLTAGSYTIGPDNAATVTIADNDTPGTASISGTIYLDKNFNTWRDNGEGALSGITLFLDSNGDDIRQAGEPQTTTDGSGNYSFTGLAPGFYNVRELPGQPYVFTTPVGAYQVSTGQALSGTGFGAFPTTFTGTAAADAFTLSPVSNAAKVQINVNGTIYTALRSQVPTITFNGGGGSDSLSVDLSGGVAFATQTVYFDGGGGTDTASVASGTVNFTAPQKLSLLTIGATGRVNLSGSNATVISSLSDSGILDVGSGGLIIDYTSPSQLNAIQALINLARAGGQWTGNGITSSAAKGNPLHNTTLGAMEANDWKALPGNAAALFAGQSVDTTAVLIKYTYYGDANFDGKVNFDDYQRTDSGFNQHKTGWLNGDFNGDGLVNFDDYQLIDLAFNTQGSVVLRPSTGERPDRGKLGRIA